MLRGPPSPLVFDGDAAAWWRAAVCHLEGIESSVDRAIVGGWLADRVGLALVAGYQSAVRELVTGLDEETVVSFCVTEGSGNHPRAIGTKLETLADGAGRLDGEKRWGTLAPLADQLVVVASQGFDDRGRNQLRAVQISTAWAGIHVTALPPTPFVPEVPHGEVQLHDVIVPAGSVLPGDGYADYIKRFRTLEDIRVHAAVLGYVASVARRHAWPEPVSERLAMLLVAARSLGDLDPAAAETHVALAGLLESGEELLEEARSLWQGVPTDERERWQRDRGLLAVAGTMREKRRQRAWQTLAAPSK